ncbi:ubiquinol-cytochrome C chaperone family protein [Pusillimonas sp. SM2304]|uniref:ubiquinol-cytochrome C chaperone family protein n=1 Tax=Pusillimonas sp. SM2304 TaxID=3073241 RepID=UPI0028761399|nr:ubiquinol-cytochrome C chaperone family protein [Pusillimonas sp. SM2304]MDS1140875.1 ubiquinol-cytochrome C chaperone family protein [Pusillimonas sp. SM2304]
MAHSIDPDLDNLLLDSDSDDINILIDHITAKGDGRISLSAESCAQLVLAKASGRVSPEDVALISQELRKFGGNTLLNLFRRGRGVAYKELLCDVADHLKVNYNKNSDCPKIEMVILLKVLEESIDRMTEQEREALFNSLGANFTGTGPLMMASLQAAIKASGFAAYKLSAIVAQATSTAILGRGLVFTTTAPLMRGAGAFAGPIGWAITGIWTVFDLASPAYRVTVPCVVQIAYMRQKAYSAQEKEGRCPQCDTPVSSSAKFCGECGCRLKN